MPTFEVQTPVGANQIWMKTADPRGGRRSDRARQAAAELGRLDHRRELRQQPRPGTPIIHFDQWERDEIEVKLILKGGGCENMNAQYSLPAELPHLGRADRTLEGVRKCILHAVWNAQGKGCAPGAVGVCIGGDRTSGYVHAKEQLFRTLDDMNPDPRLAELEAVDHGRGRTSSAIGTMGFGGTDLAHRLQDRRAEPAARKLLRVGRLRLLGVPAAWRRARRDDRRDQASGCIAIRRTRRRRWPTRRAASSAPAARVVLRAPLTEEQVRVAEGRRRRARLRPRLHRPGCRPRAPDEARAAGRSARRRALSLRAGGGEGRRTAGGSPPPARRPAFAKSRTRRTSSSATACARSSARAAWARRRWPALKESGAVYLNAIGGAAQFYARCIERVDGVSLMEFGTPEAMWHLEVEDFPAIVTMDAHGNSLHKEVESSRAQCWRRCEAIARPRFASVR